MEKSDEFIKGRIIWKAEQYNCPSETVLLFEDISENHQAKGLSSIDTSQVGTPVLLFNGENGTWTLICTKGFVFESNGIVNSIEFSEIRNHAIGDDPFDKLLKNTSKRTKKFDKREQHKILIENRDDEILEINAKKGSDIFALYNLLLMMLNLKEKKE
eukprot:CAMPEP_0119206522 /NCGR_PEP_ID=MMETSP1316-20130426/40430_1 /TAXON_ID=41880 /ORGANISM="Pycnococcus provasolii, Strain RCC2336" /LENGTH=157 /DNA_ID=CAMNT_0007202923 /DNA_START=1085 /DNA_END=1555 /DNA_ORIENTATION=+